MKLFLDFSLAAGVVLSALILVLLFKQGKRDQAKKVLISIFILVFLVLLFTYGYLNRNAVIIVTTFIFESSSAVMIGPMIYLYIKCLVSNSSISLKTHGVHFIFPLLYIFIISIPGLYNGISKKHDLEYLDDIEFLASLSIIYSLVYCIISLKLLNRFQEVIKRNYSNIDNRDLRWIFHFLSGIIAVILIDITTTLYELTFGVLEWNIGYLTIVPIVYLIAYLGYFGLSQSKILLPDHLMKSIDSSEAADSVPDKKLAYDTDEMKGLEEKLKEAMKAKQPYLEEDLTLRKLSALISTTDKTLSALLNQHMNISFYDYINSFRVEEVKLRMQDTDFDNLTLLGIAYECGFPSKTTFNRVFKKFTSLSPSAYRKQLSLVKK